MGEAIGDVRDRRGAARVESLGQAFVLFGDEDAVTYRVENLSSGGALLSGGPPIRWGERLQLLLRVEPLPPFHVEARVVWRGEGDAARFGVEFVSLDAAAQDAIQDAVGAILSGQRGVARARLPSWLP